MQNHWAHFTRYLLNKGAPPDKFNSAILIGIAGVAVVVWTGALIFRQLKDGWQHRAIQNEIAARLKVRPAATDVDLAGWRNAMTFDAILQAGLDYIQSAFVLPLGAAFIAEQFWRPFLIFVAILYSIVYAGAIPGFNRLVKTVRESQIDARGKNFWKHYIRESRIYAKWQWSTLLMYLIIFLLPRKITVAYVALAAVVTCVQLIALYQHRKIAPL